MPRTRGPEFKQHLRYLFDRGLYTDVPISLTARRIFFRENTGVLKKSAWGTQPKLSSSIFLLSLLSRLSVTVFKHLFPIRNSTFDSIHG
ncbi:MAG: hypothetical protein K9N21_09470 [Deltaproteobacteria bacterium]|nr:hypothetical protein [Deltaproteobacteria bacterium]